MSPPPGRALLRRLSHNFCLIYQVAAVAAVLLMLPHPADADASRSQPPHSPLHKVTIVGSGNFGSAVARVLGRNVLQHPERFEPEVCMWVFEEELADGRKLSEVINAEHENVKYLPGVQLPPNVRAVPDLEEAARDASIVIFVVPHQFVPGCKYCMRKGGWLGEAGGGVSNAGANPDCHGYMCLLAGLFAQPFSKASYSSCFFFLFELAAHLLAPVYTSASHILLFPFPPPPPTPPTPHSAPPPPLLHTARRRSRFPDQGVGFQRRGSCAYY